MIIGDLLGNKGFGVSDATVAIDVLTTLLESAIAKSPRSRRLATAKKWLATFFPDRKRRRKGTGSICRRADGRWVAAFDVGESSDGKRRKRVLYARTKLEAQRKLNAILPEKVLERNCSVLVGELRAFKKEFKDGT